jgi:hypothetical protein
MSLPSHLHSSHLQEGLRREALRAIVSELGDRLEAISPSDYRALREISPEQLPPPATIWEMFGGFHRMRECAASIDAAEADYRCLVEVAVGVAEVADRDDEDGGEEEAAAEARAEDAEDADREVGEPDLGLEAAVAVRLADFSSGVDRGADQRDRGEEEEGHRREARAAGG